MDFPKEKKKVRELNISPVHSEARACLISEIGMDKNIARSQLVHVLYHSSHGLANTWSNYTYYAHGIEAELEWTHSLCVLKQCLFYTVLRHNIHGIWSPSLLHGTMYDANEPLYD